MELKKPLSILSLLLLTLLLQACSLLQKPEKEVVIETKIVKRNIEVKKHPIPLDLKGVSWYVVTEENLEEFKTRFAKENNEFVFYAMSVSDYERMAINLAEITRYIEQQKQLLLYYEKAVQE
jgi:leucyl aminopeptidase (aminopeptidase T)